MPRDIPVGNGQMLVCFDQHYQIRDFYFPHVGQENHVNGSPCRFGVWSALPQNDRTASDRRKRRLFWSDQGWRVHLGYHPDTLCTDARLTHDYLQLRLHCSDVVDFHRSLLVRRVDVHNDADEERTVNLFHHNNFSMNGTRVGDTAYFDPTMRCVLHYQGARYIMTGWYADGEQRMDEFATGTAGFQSAEGTWRDAEDGTLGNNPIAQGAVDSTIMLQLSLAPGESRTAYMLIGCGHSYKDIEQLHRFIHREGPQSVIDRTTAYWRLWLAAARVDIPDQIQGGPSDQVVELFKRSLLVMRTQIDNSGAVIAANDTDIMQFQRDTYSYLWPRDGALVASALDDAGFPDIARSFYSLCARIIDDQGYFLHKYNPDGTPASSWHPWVSLGKPQLPIQEDETALVLWALWRHYVTYRDIEFVRPLWVNLVTKAADFLVRFCDPDTHLPMPGYNLWEDSWGVHAYTVASVYGGLQAAWQFAVCFGDTRRAQSYATAAGQIRDAFMEHFWSKEHDRFLRRIVPLDHARTARLMADVMAGRTPRSDQEVQAMEGDPSTSAPIAIPAQPGNASVLPRGPWVFEYDPIIDSSMLPMVTLGLLKVDDPRTIKTMTAVEQALWLRGQSTGGLARYQGDTYHRVGDRNNPEIPGNPWFITTLWLADWRIARATNAQELKQTLPILQWVAQHALPSGVLAEQVHPLTHQPLSVSPLTWSHAAVVSTLTAYVQRLHDMDRCPTCGRSHQTSEHTLMPHHPCPHPKKPLEPITQST